MSHYQDKEWEMLPQIHQGVMDSWHILKTFLKEEEIVRYCNGWNPLSSKTQIKNIKDWHNKKGEESKDEAPVAHTSKPQAKWPPQEGKKNKKKELEETIFLKLQHSKNPEIWQGKNLDGIQGKRRTKNETTPFLKEIILSSDVLNTLTEIKIFYL
ncbi:hypothetical protein O181_108946 [Austropuccinia psidii MF-1]|uniref:Uncharacterized protein n=1 Tax=Austropuccinia psidii MF-1 TaxID=1389203 RepID=A0A9Q3JWA0_9BASI|nr:hypothetical protein [Austropuccinia psidii MF-1]